MTNRAGDRPRTGDVQLGKQHLRYLKGGIRRVVPLKETTWAHDAFATVSAKPCPYGLSGLTTATALSVAYLGTRKRPPVHCVTLGALRLRGSCKNRVVLRHGEHTSGGS